MKRLLQFAVAAAMVAGLHGPKPAGAVDLAGAWATSADECPNVFVRRGRAKQIEFAALSDQHGGGFIVEADRLRGKFARCKIKTQEGGWRHREHHRGLRDRHHAFQRPVQPQDARAEQDIADLSGHRGHGDQLSPLSDLIVVAVDEQARAPGRVDSYQRSGAAADQYWRDLRWGAGFRHLCCPETWRNI